MLRAAVICLFLTSSVAAYAQDCPGNPNALGVSRTIVVDPAEHPRIGSFQYPETLPLRDKEVVLTFDDAPRPIYTAKVLDILKANCLKATYFIIGSHAKEFPKVVQRIQAEGHTIGTHSMKHPLTFNRMSPERLAQEIDAGIDAIAGALGDETLIAPFFRIPGLLRSDAVDTYLQSVGLMVWSTDVMAHDWKRIKPEGIIRRAIDRLDAKGKGVLLLHDIHERTATALPSLLLELKARGYRIVHVVPATPELPATPSETQEWVFHAPNKTPLPALFMADITNLNEAMREGRDIGGIDFCGEKIIARHRFATQKHWSWRRRHHAAAKPAPAVAKLRREAKVAPAKLRREAKAAPAKPRQEAAVTTMRTD
jgi:peptidoglycan/xylan/chitin deacetylase (PgdA/CDA1 family)